MCDVCVCLGCQIQLFCKFFDSAAMVLVGVYVYNMLVKCVHIIDKIIKLSYHRNLHPPQLLTGCPSDNVIFG